MVEIVAEFTTNHCGNLNVLLRMVEQAAKAGADSIKMQKKDVETFYSLPKLDAPYESPYGHTYRDYRTVFEFDEYSDWWQFDASCGHHHMHWFVTIQDKPSYVFMVRAIPHLGRWKVASSNARNTSFLPWLAAEIPKTHEIVISTGGSLPADIEQALAISTSLRGRISHQARARTAREYHRTETAIRDGPRAYWLLRPRAGLPADAGSRGSRG
jgi:N-acetylneuraminate synthase